MDNFSAHSNSERAEMLKDIGVNRVEELFVNIPAEARVEGLNLPDSMSEMSVQKELKRIAAKNKTDYLCFLGGGASKRFVPACVSQIANRFEFNTAYTPYQPEISQGTLQMIYEYQSMICNLTGLDVANASVYDGASACAEALLMSVRIANKNKVLVSNSLNPEYKEVINTYIHSQGLEVEYFNNLDILKDISDEYAAVLVQNPDFYGEIQDLDGVKSLLEGKKTLLVICADIMSLGFLKAPAEYGADIAVGDIQPLGIPLNFGGPYGGFIACLDKHKRQLAGRIVGRTVDSDGNQAFTLTLQTREQHIRREKATSNICSNQGLVALCAAVYLSVMGKNGFKQASYLSAKNAHMLAKKLEEQGIKLLNKDFFNEFVIEVENSDEFLKKMKENGILAGLKIDENKVLVTTTEMNTDEEIDEYISKV